MTNEELVARIQAGEDDLLEQLWEQTNRLIAFKARGLLIEANGTLDVTFDDLYNTGFLALVEAVKTYSETGAKFTTWLGYYLKTAFAETAGYRTVKQKKDPSRFSASLSAPVNDEDEDADLSDFMADPHAEEAYKEVENQIWMEQLRSTVHDVLDDMPLVQSEVIRKRYLEGLTLEQTGREMGVHKNEIIKSEEAALRLLRRGKYAKRLRPFYDFNCYCGTGSASFRNTGLSVQERYLIQTEKRGAKV